MSRRNAQTTDEQVFSPILQRQRMGRTQKEERQEKIKVFIIWYSMNRIWWNFNWAEFQWINGNFSFGVPSYSVHSVLSGRPIKEIYGESSLNGRLEIYIFFRFASAVGHWIKRKRMPMPGSLLIWLRVPEKLISDTKRIISTRYSALNPTKCPFTGKISWQSVWYFINSLF